VNQFAERLADSYADYEPEVREVLDRVIASLAGQLEESPEAWRGAEAMLALIGQAFVATSDSMESTDDALAIRKMLGGITAAFLAHPCARADRARR